MKRIILGSLVLSALLFACNNDNKEQKSSSSSSIKLPYEASYTTEFTNNVSDSDLLTVLNSYKYWETGDIKGLRGTMGDSMFVHGADGFKFEGKTDSLMPMWEKARDSMTSVVIKMNVWLKNHAAKDTSDFINVWYKEIDTYKSGRVDSANYEDDNAMKNGKIIWYSSHRQSFKPAMK